MKILIFALALSTSLFAKFIPFDQGFGTSWNERKATKLAEFMKAYDINHFDHVIPTEKPRIPKVIHHVWLGSNLPPIYKKYVDSWKKQHPEWEYKLWTDSDIGSFPLLTGDKIHQTNNQGQRSDIFRAEILYRFGGLYVDTDFLSLKSQDILHHTCDFYASTVGNAIFNGLMGSSPKHPIMKGYLDVINSLTKFSRNPNQIPHETGPYLLTKLILDYYKTSYDGVIVYPGIYFYAFPSTLRQQFWKQRENMDLVKPYITSDAFAIHLWAVSWSKNLKSTR